MKVKPWPRGRCEHWTSDRTMCGKDGRWMIDGEIMCGEHKRFREGQQPPPGGGRSSGSRLAGDALVRIPAY